MAENEKITTKLEVDVTQFKKGLSDANRYIRLANSEFENATAGMEKWSGSADGLRAKLAQLNKTMDGQEAALAVLRHEYERVVAEQGESSKGAQELAVKINKQEAAVKKTAAQIGKYSQDLDELESNTEAAEKETIDLSGAFGKAAAAAGKLATGMAKVAGKTLVNGIKGLAVASAGLVTAFLASGEAQKEHITEMAKLDAAYKSAGHSAEAAGKTYEELYSVIGETDQAVEAAQQIALLADSEKDAAAWAEQAAAVTGRFGDALQPEVFYESANETLKLNEATGAYVQMLEGTGQDVEAFNKGLQACRTEEEKQAYMLAATQKALGSAGEEYRKANAAVIENNKANAKLQESLAGVGKAALPVMTALKNMGAGILVDLLPGVEQLGRSFQGALNGSETAAKGMGTAISSILKQLIGKLVEALPTIITVGTSVVESLISGLIAAAPALAAGVGQIVQYFIQAAPQLLEAGAAMISSLVGAIKTNLPLLLSAGGDMLYKILDGIVSNLPSMAQGALDAIGGFVQSFQTNLPIIMEKGKELLGKLGEGIRSNLPGLIDQALDILMNFATTLYDNAPMLIETGFDLLSDLVQGILDALPTLLSKGPEIISKFANIINDNFPTILKKGVELIWQIIKGIIQAIPTLVANIPKIVTAIVDVIEAFNWLNLGKNIIKFFKDGIIKMVGAVKTAGKNIFNSIVNVLKQLPQNLLNLGKNAITWMKNGITSMASSAAGSAKNIFSSIVNIIKALPGKLLEFGKNAISRLGSAIGSGVGTVKSKAKAIFDGVVSTIKGLPDKLLGIGKDLVTGLWNGISDMTGWIIGKIQGFGEDILGGIKDFFGIGSPSKVFRDEVGKWLPAGMAEGVKKNAKVANKAMANMAKGALGAANATLSGASLAAPGVSVNGAGGIGAAGRTVVFNQYNNSPKALSRAEIYRQTKNQLRFATQT